MDHIRKAFGDDVDLHDVLGLTNKEDAENPAKLRKAYFRKALIYHPDKTKEKDAEVAKAKFQAISFAYQVLKHPEKRAAYIETGHVDENDEDDDDLNEARQNWKTYFETIFGKLTTSKIDAFAVKYKCSEEEQRDVLKYYKQFKGDLNKMLEFVMLSSLVDAQRWVEDYIKPAVAEGTVPDYNAMVQKSLKKIDKKIEKEQTKAAESQKNQPKKKSAKKKKEDDEEEEEHDDEDEEEEEMDEDATETESEGEPVTSPPPKKNQKKASASASAKKVKATKAKPTKAKASKKNKKGNEDDLVAMIQANREKRSGGAFFADMAARYGGTMEEDPLGDEEFEKIQAKISTKKKRAR